MSLGDVKNATEGEYGGSGLDMRDPPMNSPEENADIFAIRFAAVGPSLAPAGRRVAQHIDQNRAAVLASSVLGIGSKTKTSDATVVRVIQELGFTDLAELKQALVSAIERPSTPGAAARRTLADVGEETAQAVSLVLETHGEALRELHSPDSQAAITRAVGVLHPAERIVVFGVGSSSALATYVALLLTRSGRRSGALNVTGRMLADQLVDLHAGDALIVLASGQAQPEVTAVFAVARRVGLPIVLIADDLDRKLVRLANVVVPARRGHAGHVALHGATVVCLEALVLGLAAAHRRTATASLDRLKLLQIELGAGDVVGARTLTEAESLKPRAGRTTPPEGKY